MFHGTGTSHSNHMSVARDAFPLFATTTTTAKNTVIPFPYFVTAQRIPAYFDPKSFVVAVAIHIFVLFKANSIQSQSFSTNTTAKLQKESDFFPYYCWQ